MLEKRNLNYYTHPSFLQFEVQKGVLRSRGGTRMVGISEDFLRGFVSACEHEAGSAAALILRRCGTFFGTRLGRRFEAELSQYAGVSMRDRPMCEFDALIQDLWHGCGMGHLTVDWPKAQLGIIPVTLENSPMQDIGPGAGGGVVISRTCPRRAQTPDRRTRRSPRAARGVPHCTGVARTERTAAWARSFAS